MPPPFQFGIGLDLAMSGAGGLDPAAAAYIAAVASKGVTVSGIQKSAINAFFVAEKAGGRWTSHKGLFLPIWNLAAANAINMVTLASGTYTAGPVPSVGYITSVGSGGFNTQLVPLTIGMTNESASLSVLLSGVTTGVAENTYVGNYSGAAMDVRLYTATYAIYFEAMTTSGAQSVALDRSLQSGIFIGSRYGGAHAIYQRKTSGIQTLLNTVVAAAGAAPTTDPIYAMAYNAYGGYSDPCSGPFGFFGVHLGMSAADSTAFSLNLKTLWETCTGLILP